MTDQNFSKIAVQAARLGGEILMKYFGNVDAKSITTKQVGDWVSEADRASEDRIIKYLREIVPEHDILTEERGHVPPKVSSEICPYRWIIDPLDGTTNFLRGFPLWAISVGLEKRSANLGNWGEIVAGAVFIPVLDDMFHAEKSHGAYRNGEKITVNASRKFNEGLIGTGFPFRTRHLIDPYTKILAEFLLSSADVRRPGAAAVDLCFVAAGIYDGFWELDLAPWDIAAGSLIIREAGGKVGNFQGGADFLTTGDIVAASENFYAPMLDVTKRYFPEERNVDKSVK